MLVTLAPNEHGVRFYETDAELIGVVASYVRETLVSGGVAVVAATPAHVLAVEAALGSEGIDVGGLRSAGVLITLDATAAAERLAAGPSVDRTVFERIIGDPVRRAVRTGRAVRVFGEIVAELWDADRVIAAIELERLWNEFRDQAPFSLLCAYPGHVTSGPAADVEAMCAEHSMVLAAVPEGGDVAGSSGLATRTLPASVLSPRSARRFVTETLADSNPADVIHDLAMVAGELATNAVIHAGSEFTVTVSWTRNRVRVAVRDGSSAPPRLGRTSMETSGRGLILVSALADRWGSEPLDGGKVVWAELSRGPDPAPGPATV
jgi:anti-sigma regulatory factor (Ser/Thr protein kinase)